MKKQTPTAPAHTRQREGASRPAGNETYRQQLLTKRSEVLTALGVKFDTIARMGRVAEEDQAQITHDEFVSLHLNSIDYLQLRLVDEALDRLNSGDYGTCMACEEAIPVKRLRALPWARYCISCQETAGAQMDRDWAQARPKPPLASATE